MKIDTIEQSYAKQLADLISAESQLGATLIKFAGTATDERLKLAFEDQLEQTIGQRERLGKLLAKMNGAFKRQTCAVMDSLIEEGDAIISDGGNSQVVDAGLIAAMQRVKRYEIAAYGLAIESARMLGREDDLPLLEQSLGEEKGASILLTRIASGGNLASAAEPVVATLSMGRSALATPPLPAPRSAPR